MRLLRRAGADAARSGAAGGNGYSGSFYLLGSIHVSDGLTYPQELLDAYAACDTLAVESDVLALEADLSAQVEMMRCLV